MLLAQNASQVFITDWLVWLRSKLPSMIACRCALGRIAQCRAALQHGRAQIALDMPHGCLEQPVLAGEIVADDAGGDARTLGDSRDRGIGQTRFIDRFQRCLNELAAADGLHTQFRHGFVS